MMHWTEQYIGKGYDERTNNCAHLLIDVQYQVFNKEVDIAVPERPEEFNRAIEKQRVSLAQKINTPSEGCAVLLISKGRPSHIGIYTEINNEPYVLHALEKRGVCLHKITKLHHLQMEVEGYYEFKDNNETNAFTTSNPTSTG